MTVKSIADHAGYSASRFSRGFTRLQGESVMSYVRGRRLEAAMGRLFAEPDLRIVDLAFDSGFDSQEAFTRAFVRAFGHPPGRLRTLGPVRYVMRRKKSPAHEPEIHERVEQVPELHLAGLVRRIAPANPQVLPQTWQRLESVRGFPGELDASTYFVVLNFDPRDGGAEALSALRVRADAAPPPELNRRTLPAATCAVFRHVVRKGDVFPQISAARAVNLYAPCVAPAAVAGAIRPPSRSFRRGSRSPRAVGSITTFHSRSERDEQFHYSSCGSMTAGTALSCTAIMPGARIALAAPPSTKLQDAVQEIADATVESGDIPGVVAQVWRKGELVADATAGWLDMESKAPMDRGAIFGLASMTKPVTVALALRLMDEGKLRLDDPITRWAPEFVRDARAAPT